MRNRNRKTNKWKRTLATVLACGLLPAALLAGCGSNQPEPAKSEVTQESAAPVGASFELQTEETADPLAFASANAQIAIDILKARSQKEKPDEKPNLLFSPLSL